MRTTDIEISRALSRALADAGYNFTPKFRHCPTGPLSLEEWLFGKSEFDQSEFKAYAPAFCMWELWEMLPENVYNDSLTYGDGGGDLCKLELAMIDDICYAEYNECDYTVNHVSFKDKNPCNALAQLTIWCIENNHPLNLTKDENK